MSRKINFFDGASSETTPVLGNLIASNLVSYANDAAYEAAESGAPAEGNIYWNTTLKLVRYYNGSSWISVVDESTAQTLTNKTISYNNGTSGLVATNVQAAIDEVEGRVDAAEGNITDLETLSGSAGLTNHGVFSGTTISDNSSTKGALQELETAVEARIPSSEKGAPNGVAELDGSGTVPLAQLPSSITGALSYAGTWNASTNTPTLASGVGNQGDYYVVSVAGSTNLDGITDWQIGDWAVYNGTAWEKIDNTESVTSVNSQTGTVVLDTDDISEGVTNLYYTNARADARIAAASINDLSDVDTTTTPPTDGQALVWDSVGSEWIPGEAGGTGQGGINYITNYGAETDTTGWTGYDDGAGVAPVDGTGGSTSLVFSRTTTAAEILRGDASFKIAKPGLNLQGDGISYDFSIDPQDENKALTVSFDYKTAASYASGDYTVFVYDIDNLTLLGPVSNGESGVILASSTPARFVGTFYTTDSSNYRLIIHCSSTNASTTTLIYDNVKVSPDATVPGAIVTDWQSFTPSSSMPSATLTHSMYRRVGSIAEIIIKWDATGSIATVADPSYWMVPNTTLNESILIGSQTLEKGRSPIGRWHFSDAGVNAYTGVIEYREDTQDLTMRSDVGDTLITIASGDTLTLFIEAPITEWSAGAVLSTTETLLKSAKVIVERGSTTTTALAGTIDFDTAEYDEQSLFNFTTDRFVPAVSGYYFVALTAQIGVNTGAKQIQIRKNGTGLYFQNDSTGAASAGTNLSASGLIYLNKAAGDYIDFYADSSADTISKVRASIFYVPDFSKFSIYGETDFQSSTTALAAWSITAGQFGDLTSITLTPGEWDVSAGSWLESTAATTTTLVYLGFSTTSGNSSTGLTQGENYFIQTKDTTSGSIDQLVIPPWRVIVTATTTYYLKGRANTSITNLSHASRISARKIK